MKKEFITCVLHNRKRNLDYGDHSKYLALPTEIQVAGFGIQALVVESFYK